MARAQLDVGSTANSYSILAFLASGGMAELFLARNASAAGIERYVVLKRVLRSHDPEDVKMFLDEAKLAAQLQHPNVAQVYDTGKLGDSFFFTMEYVHGETVRELILRAASQGRVIPIPLALTIIAGAAAGLHHAHERIGIDGQPLGIVHRDVSPSNLMVSYEGNVKLVDFGIAKARSRSTETRSGTVRGKIAYLSPEQCRTKPLDRRSDLFSLGIVLWELLVRNRLHDRSSDYENMSAIINEDAPLPSSRRPDVPTEVDAIVRKLLARKTQDRFQTGAEVLEEIERVAATASWQLSTAALGRFMRELFGHKPEPWIELRGRESARDAVTVTAQPVDGIHPWSISVDPQLSNVIDLAALTGATSIAARGGRRLLRSALVAVAALVLVVVIVLVIVRRRGDDTAATSKSASRSSSSALAVVPPSPSPPPLLPPSPPPPSPPPPSTPSLPAPASRAAPAPRSPAAHAEDLATIARAGRSSEVVAACSANAKVVALNAATCTLAACRIDDAPHAQRWLLAVPAGKRAEITRSCLKLGTVIDTKPKPPPKRIDCDADPLACRR